MAYKARDRDDLIAGVDEFLDEVIVLPPGEWDPKIRIEPPKKVPSAEMRSASGPLHLHTPVIFHEVMICIHHLFNGHISI